MKSRTIQFTCVFIVVLLFTGGYVLADTSELGRITAEQAFDAVMAQKDPISGEAKKVALVDVRTRAEFFWVGAATKVDEIVLDDGRSIIPKSGKALLIAGGRFLLVKQHHWPIFVPVHKVKEMKMSPIAINIPYKLWDEETATTYKNEAFKNAVEELALEQGVEVVIFFCRSGGRSQACLEDFDNAYFDAIYEIDRPDGQDGYGGFEGTSYGNAYIGYRGFPGRDTQLQQAPSVSWKDSSLPTKTGVNPLQQ